MHISNTPMIRFAFPPKKPTNEIVFERTKGKHKQTNNTLRPKSHKNPNHPSLSAR